MDPPGSPLPLSTARPVQRCTTAPVQRTSFETQAETSMRSYTYRSKPPETPVRANSHTRDDPLIPPEPSPFLEEDNGLAPLAPTYSNQDYMPGVGSATVDEPPHAVDSDFHTTLRYTVKDVPPWYICIILGFQHYLTMLGSTVLIPTLIVPAFGGDTHDLARVIQT